VSGAGWWLPAANYFKPVARRTVKTTVGAQFRPQALLGPGFGSNHCWDAVNLSLVHGRLGPGRDVGGW